MDRILVRAPNWTGDVIMATPGFRALRKGFPDAHIALQISRGLAPLLAGSPWFDRVVAMERGSFTTLRREVRRLREAGPFDLGVCMPDSWSSALLMRAAGVGVVVGYRRDGRGWILQRPVDPPREKGRRKLIARERHVLGLVEAAGCAPDGTHLELFTTEEEENLAEQVFATAGVRGEVPIVAVAPGASFGPSKLWPAESFARAADALAEQGAQVVVLGTPAERPLVAQVVAAMRAPAADLAGRFGLGGLKAVIRRAAVLLCNDAGARHVAVAFGVPCVVAMGPTALEKTDLNLEHVTVLTAEVGCRPCYHRVCPTDHRCMTRIPPERVIETARAALA